MPELLLGALRRGARARALQLVGAMQARGIAVPTRCFNALIASDALLGLPAAAGAPAEVHLRLMRDAGAAPDRGTLEALTKAFLYAGAPPASGGPLPQRGGEGASAFLLSTSRALGVPLTQRALGLAAFFAAKHGNAAEVEALIRLLQSIPRRPGAPPPRWLRKLSFFVMDAVTEPQRRG